MSAANTVVENGGRVVLLDKSSFCGGNSTKATSGINGAGRFFCECLVVLDLGGGYLHLEWFAILSRMAIL